MPARADIQAKQSTVFQENTLFAHICFACFNMTAEILENAILLYFAQCIIVHLQITTQNTETGTSLHYAYVHTHAPTWINTCAFVFSCVCMYVLSVHLQWSWLLAQIYVELADLYSTSGSYINTLIGRMFDMEPPL